MLYFRNKGIEYLLNFIEPTALNIRKYCNSFVSKRFMLLIRLFFISVRGIKVGNIAGFIITPSAEL